jgi:DNA-binding Lrp family transcriptional regulator
MKSNELEILELLKQNARMSAKDISKCLGVSEKEVDKTINKLEKSGIIAQYTTVINENKLEEALLIRALIQVSIRPEKNKGFDAIAGRICKYENVVDHYLMSGQYDLLIVVEGKTLQEISAFVSEKLASLDNVRSTATHFILKKYKEKGCIIESKSSESRLRYSP